jgi:hypothetical protein
MATQNPVNYSREEMRISPIIVISTITGALSFIASGFDRRQTSSYLQLGGVGEHHYRDNEYDSPILNVAELKCIGRRIFRGINFIGIGWNWRKPQRTQRRKPFIRLCRQGYDRLTEISPIIAPCIYLFLKYSLAKRGAIQRKRFELLKPDVVIV